MVRRYRKKPVEIEAVQVRDDGAEAREFLRAGGARFHEDSIDPAIVIETLEGDMRAEGGDWIIRGVKGEFYPCKPDIFEATYDVVGEREAAFQEDKVIEAVAREIASSEGRNFDRSESAKQQFWLRVVRRAWIAGREYGEVTFIEWRVTAVSNGQRFVYHGGLTEDFASQAVEKARDEGLFDVRIERREIGPWLVVSEGANR